MTTKIKLASNVSDVDLTTTAPTNGQGLIYNSTSSKWVPGAAGGGVTSYASIDDLPLSGNAEGDLALVQVAAAPNMLYIWSDSGWYNIAIVNTNPSITSGNNTPYLLATDGTPTEITLIASDPEGIPLTWSYEVTSGSLTNGGGTTATVSNDGGGQFTVTPTTTEAYAGAFSLTFKASDGVNLGTTVAAFTLAFRIPNSNYTTLLAKGTAATQNATFVDSSTNAHTITRNGDVYQGTFSPYRAGGYSMYFDGNGDYLAVSDSDGFFYDSGAFTIETWIYFNSLNNDSTPLMQQSDSTSGYVLKITWRYDHGSNILQFSGHNPASTPVTWISSPVTLQTKVWYHLVLVRDGNNWAQYVNGSRIGTATTTTAVPNVTSPLYINYFIDTPVGPAWSYLNGYLSNTRIVKGTAVYDPTLATVSVPTNPLTAITNTSLLINTPYIADSSTNAHTITVNGNTSTKPFSPFDYRVYDAAVNGGSAYFDGSGDYLAFSDAVTVLGSSDFTIEAWVYPKATGTIISNMTSGRDNNYFAVYTNNFTVRDDSSEYILTLPTPLTLNVWSHIAITRSGNTYTYWVNGVSQVSGNSTKVITARTMQIGAFLYTGFESYFSGYMSNFRMVKGTAIYTTTFTPPTAPLTAITNTSTSFLLNFTNAGIQDYSQVSDLKLVGNATGSSTQKKYASYSMYFDGAGDYLLGNDITLGSADFTIECWWYTGSTSRQAILHGSNGYDHSYAIDYNSRGNYKMGIWASSTGSSWNLANADAGGNGIGSATIAQNTWTHIAFVRNGTVLRLYVNGTLDVEITGVSAAVATRPSNQPIIGMWFDGTQYANSGYIEDLRITKGLARYPTNPFPTDQLLG